MHPIVITGQTRGGSSYIHNLVATYYGIRNFKKHPRNYVLEPWGDITNPLKIQNDPIEVQQERCLEMIYRIHKEIHEYPVYIIKDHVQHYKYYELIMGEPFPFDRIYKNFHRILITRKDHLAMTFSLAISLTTKTWNDFGRRRDINISIPHEIFLQAKNLILSYHGDMVNWRQRGIRYDDIISYESLTGDAEKDRFKLQTTSGHRESPLRVVITRRKSYKDAVKNWQELEKLYHDS